MQEHNSNNCLVCKEHGNWANTSDTEAWMKAHTDAGIKLALVPATVTPYSTAAYELMP